MEFDVDVSKNEPRNFAVPGGETKPELEDNICSTPEFLAFG